MYAIKPGYIERPKPFYFADPPSRIIWQPDVYRFAADIAEARGASRIVDIGCGRARKLDALHGEHPDWDFVGLDYGSNIEWCCAQYGWGEWLEVDLDCPHTIDATGAVLVSADVIEHLKAPHHLLTAIRLSGCVAAVLSTPERDLTWGVRHNGPPPNLCHVREWNRAEFGELLASEGFTVDHLGLTRSDDTGTGERTILAVVS